MPQTAYALELYGVNLESTNRDELRNAVKQAGVILIREGGEDADYDIYDSSAVLDGSSRLYLSFLKQDQQFVFAEYEFDGLDSKRLIKMLTTKYGVSKATKGKYISDYKYRWQQDGIDIQLTGDWKSHKTRLSYINPSTMELLVKARATGQLAGANGISIF